MSMTGLLLGASLAGAFVGVLLARLEPAVRAAFAREALDLLRLREAQSWSNREVRP